MQGRFQVNTKKIGSTLYKYKTAYSYVNTPDVYIASYDTTLPRERWHLVIKGQVKEHANTLKEAGGKAHALQRDLDEQLKENKGRFFVTKSKGGDVYAFDTKEAAVRCSIEKAKGDSGTEYLVLKVIGSSVSTLTVYKEL